MDMTDKFIWLGLAAMSFSIIIVALYIALTKKWISNTLFIIIIILLVTVGILSIVGYYLSHASTTPLSTKLVDPVDAGRAIEHYYLHHEGIPNITLTQKRTANPPMKIGRDPFWRGYVTYPTHPTPIALKVSLSRGIKAIENGWINFDDDFDLKFDKREDKQFSPDVATSLLEDLEDLPMDIRKGILGTKDERSPDKIVIENQLAKLSEDIHNGVDKNE